MYVHVYNSFVHVCVMWYFVYQSVKILDYVFLRCTHDYNFTLFLFWARSVQGTDTAKTVWGVGGGAERSLGPDSLLIATNKATLAGRFLVYDTDYVDATERGTLLLTSPVVTATQGDVWRFDP